MSFTSVITFKSAVDSVIKGNKEATKKAILITGSNIEKEAKALCPVDTGQSRASITHGLIDDKTGFASGGTDYFVNFEFGTKTQAPQPTLRPAVLLARGASEKEVIETIVHETEKAAQNLKESRL